MSAPSSFQGDRYPALGWLKFWLASLCSGLVCPISGAIWPFPSQRVYLREQPSEKGDRFSSPEPFLSDHKAPSFPAQTLAVKPCKRQKRKSPVSDDGAFSWLPGAGDGNSTRSPTRLLRTFFPIQASRNGLDCGLKSSAWSTQAVAGDPKRAKHIHQQPEHRISFRSLSVYWHTTPQAATDRRATASTNRLIIDR